MITTGANPLGAIAVENIKNNPEQALKMAGSQLILAGLPPSISVFAKLGIQGNTFIQKMAENQYYSNIQKMVRIQNQWIQDGDCNEKK